MAQITISILDPSQTKKTRVEVPDNVPANRLIRALVSKMGLPTVDERGAPVNYRLGYSSAGLDVELDGESTLQSADIQNDDVLRLHADLRAGCFLPGTRISLANGSTLPIELLYPGAQILSYDTGNRKLCTGTVQEKTTTIVNRYVVINDLISVTPSHLVYANNRWQPVRDLSIDYSLLCETSLPWRVESIKRVYRHATVYNLHLSNPEHTFFAEGILVHNEVAKSLYLGQQLKTVSSWRLADADRRLLVSEIIDAFEARTLVKIIDQIGITQKGTTSNSRNPPR